MSCGWFIITCIKCCRTHLIDYNTLIEVAKEYNLEVTRDLENFEGYKIVIKCPKYDEWLSTSYRPDQLRFVIGEQSDRLVYEVIEKDNIYIEKV